MLKRLRELAGQGKSFAFETTLATRSYAGWLGKLRQDGYRVNLMFVWLNSPGLAVEHVPRRVASGGHDIPEETIRRRYGKGIRNFLTLYQPLADEWGVFDNSDWTPLSLIASGSGKTAQTVFIPLRDDADRQRRALTRLVQPVGGHGFAVGGVNQNVGINEDQRHDNSPTPVRADCEPIPHCPRSLPGRSTSR